MNSYKNRVDDSLILTYIKRISNYDINAIYDMANYYYSIEHYASAKKFYLLCIEYNIKYNLTDSISKLKEIIKMEH